MSTTTCSRYCWGPVHIHLPADTLSQNLWMMGQSLAGIPGFFQAVASNAESQPLTEKVVDNVCFGVMSLLALGSTPLLAAGAGAAYAGEMVMGSLNTLPEMAAKVKEFGQSLSLQEKVIQEFGPLLELYEKVALISERAKKRTEELKESTNGLQELEKNCTEHPDLLTRLSDLITRLHADLTERISKSNIRGFQQKNLVLRAAVLQQIEEEETQIKDLTMRLNGLMERVGGKAARLQKFESQMTHWTLVKQEHIAGLQTDVEALIQQADLIQKTTSRRSEHGNVCQVVA